MRHMIIFFMTLFTSIFVLAAPPGNVFPGSGTSLLPRKVCRENTLWQNQAGNATEHKCTNGTDIAPQSDHSPVPKSDCQTLAQQLSSTAGTGVWGIDYGCGNMAFSTFARSGKCQVGISQVTGSWESNE